MVVSFEQRYIIHILKKNEKKLLLVFISSELPNDGAIVLYEGCGHGIRG